MSHIRLRTAAIIIACIVVGGFLLSVPRARDGVQTPAAPAAPPTVPDAAVRDVYKKGVHTITGSIMVPNACTDVQVTATPVPNADTPTSIEVGISWSQDTGVCLQLPTKKSFETSVSATGDLPITASVNGQNATTTAL
ncbi:hypothetical protein COU19_01515 [Candidatus Kaiserbacteria bacterium CG10_big_fil_rev_8_21_14_0_10_56_12]|uniref:Uncharacterized protein n=1 Tax=Candidatus Kaiserbacteria bacterium CG10_big_fil_rev_8_21_14_0_10_56_12 TaxID=1974611 RepID=A0A2H0UA17_9BACT|nr:MAG: hypothetical protein COU19_01515 [Candidatus Kaiserbacteria bacterium CG10_big_fil_rev_8_21_14_0_10_56_12]